MLRVYLNSKFQEELERMYETDVASKEASSWIMTKGHAGNILNQQKVPRPSSESVKLDGRWVDFKHDNIQCKYYVDFARDDLQLLDDPSNVFPKSLEPYREDVTLLENVHLKLPPTRGKYRNEEGSVTGFVESCPVTYGFNVMLQIRGATLKDVIDFFDKICTGTLEPFERLEPEAKGSKKELVVPKK